jgi:hypothetical protein
MRLSLQQFAQGQSLRKVLENASELATDTFGNETQANTPETVTARTFWRQVDAFVRDMLLKEGYALSSKAEADGRGIKEAFSKLNKEYRKKVLDVVAGIAKFTHAFQADNILRE